MSQAQRATSQTQRRTSQAQRAGAQTHRATAQAHCATAQAHRARAQTQRARAQAHRARSRARRATPQARRRRAQAHAPRPPTRAGSPGCAVAAAALLRLKGEGGMSTCGCVCSPPTAARREGPARHPAVLAATAHVKRGNAAGEFYVQAYGDVVGGRPVFTRTEVTFTRAGSGGRGIDVNVANLTFHPFANAVSTADYRPVNKASMIGHLNSIFPGGGGSAAATADLAEELVASLQAVSA